MQRERHEGPGHGTDATDSSLRFDGKVALVTGAGRGLGRAYAQALADRGCRLVVNDTGTGPLGGGRASAPAEEVASEIAAAGGQAIATKDLKNALPLLAPTQQARIRRSTRGLPNLRAYCNGANN